MGNLYMLSPQAFVRWLNSHLDDNSAPVSLGRFKPRRAINLGFGTKIDYKGTYSLLRETDNGERENLTDQILGTDFSEPVRIGQIYVSSGIPGYDRNADEPERIESMVVRFIRAVDLKEGNIPESRVRISLSHPYMGDEVFEEREDLLGSGGLFGLGTDLSRLLPTDVFFSSYVARNLRGTKKFAA